MTEQNTLTLNGRPVAINGEKNLLEVIRKANIDLPTFCYHSELSIYGACRLCIVEIEGMGIQTSCSIAPAAGMKVRTHTDRLRKMRRIYLELLLANHHQKCTTCVKNSMCKLQDLAARLGVDQVPSNGRKYKPIDNTNPSLVRDQTSVFGAATAYVPAASSGHRSDRLCQSRRHHRCSAGKPLNQVDCVYCGLCASVCPTAITPKPQIETVWQVGDSQRCRRPDRPGCWVLGDVRLSPAVSTGKIVAARRCSVLTKCTHQLRGGFDRAEETTEFLTRKQQGKNRRSLPRAVRRVNCRAVPAGLFAESVQLPLPSKCSSVGQTHTA